MRFSIVLMSIRPENQNDWRTMPFLLAEKNHCSLERHTEIRYPFLE